MLKLNTEMLYTTNSVKHLGIKIDENLNWRQQINNVAVKLNRAYAMLSKVRNFVDKGLWNQSITQFLHHIYSIPVLFGHRILIPLKILYVLQKKSLRLLYFLNCNNIQFLFLKIQTYWNFLIKLLLKIVFLLRIISTKPYHRLLKIGSLSL